jgi:RNA polymerase sigma-70 factor, ECF subfamily
VELGDGKPLRERGFMRHWRRFIGRLTMPRSTQDVTGLLIALQEGDKDAADRLVEAVYADLRKKAAAFLRRERPGHTLQPTALVHEAYLRLVDQNRVVWQNRAHFLGVAAEMMRRILVDHARNRTAQKRGGRQTRVTLDEALASSGPRSLDLIALDDALSELARLDPQQSRVVELRAFGGLSVEETAEVMEISPATVKRYWAFSRAWLARRMAGPGPAPAED